MTTMIKDMSVSQIESYLERLKKEEARRQRRPSKPVPPKRPVESTLRNEIVMEILQGEEVDLASLIAAAKQRGVVDLKDVKIKHARSYWSDREYGMIDAEVHVYFEKTVFNPKFKQQMEAYEMRTKAYEEKLVAYEKLLADWRALKK